MVFRSGFEQGIAWCRKVGVGYGKGIAGFVELRWYISPQKMSWGLTPNFKLAYLQASPDKVRHRHGSGRHHFRRLHNNAQAYACARVPSQLREKDFREWLLLIFSGHPRSGSLERLLN